MYSLRLSMLSGSGFAIVIGEDAMETRRKISQAIHRESDVTFFAVDGTNTVLVVNPRQIDGLMHSPKPAG
jgi:hypothetical protein